MAKGDKTNLDVGYAGHGKFATALQELLGLAEIEYWWVEQEDELLNYNDTGRLGLKYTCLLSQSQPWQRSGQCEHCSFG